VTDLLTTEIFNLPTLVECSTFHPNCTLITPLAHVKPSH